MMPKKKRMVIKILILIAVVSLITILLLVCLKTDMFKSNQTLFFKYFGKNAENIKGIEEIFEKTEYEKLLESNKYSEKEKIKINYTQDYGTTSENTDNSINDLKLTIDGQVDNHNQYQYKDFKFWKDDKQILNVEYAQNNNVYGIKFSDLFIQYVLVENSNLKEVLRNLEYSEEKIEKFPDSIQISQEEIYNSMKFSEEETQQLKEKYLNIISQSVSKGNFEKESKQTISINGQDVLVNGYVLKLTNEQLNDIYIKVLENLKEEGIILTKIDNIQNLIYKINVDSTDAINIKDEFVKEIEDTIEEIKENNIGTEETKIIVYENQGETVKTIIKGIDYQIDLEYIETQQEKFANIELKENDNKTKKLTIDKENEKISVVIENEENSTPIKITFEKDEKVENEKCTKNINIRYEDNTNKIEGNITNTTNIVESFEETVTFDNENNIKLNDLDKEELEIILNTLNETIGQKIEEVSQEIEVNDLQEMLIEIGIINNVQKLEGEGVSEVEKNRFNSKFEILKSDNIDKEGMLKNLEIIKENIVNLQVVSNEELKIEISKENKDEELIQALNNFIEESEKRKYELNIEYDNETGLVKYIVLKIIEE